jgi:hypothetical protein
VPPGSAGVGVSGGVGGFGDALARRTGAGIGRQADADADAVPVMPGFAGLADVAAGDVPGTEFDLTRGPQASERFDVPDGGVSTRAGRSADDRRARVAGECDGGAARGGAGGASCDGVKPGWCRVNLNYFISAATAEFIAAAVELIAADGYRPLPSYRFDPRTGLWWHAGGPPRPQITLRQLRYGRDGELDYPRQRERAGEEVFHGYLRQAREFLTGLPEHVDDGPTDLPPSFEALRWFPLPPGSLLTGQESSGQAPPTTSKEAVIA